MMNEYNEYTEYTEEKNAPKKIVKEYDIPMTYQGQNKKLHVTLYEGFTTNDTKAYDGISQILITKINPKLLTKFGALEGYAMCMFDGVLNGFGDRIIEKSFILPMQEFSGEEFTPNLIGMEMLDA